MSGNCSIRYATIAALGVLAILWGQTGAAPPPDAAEVLSVLRSASRVQPGETVTVRSYGQSKEALERGWTGTAYLNRDPKAAGSGTGRQFVIAAQDESLVELPPGPPSATFTREAPKGGQ